MFFVEVEPVRRFIDEAKVEILPEHWSELALNQDKVPLEPDYEHYIEREQRGETANGLPIERDGAPLTAEQLMASIRVIHAREQKKRKKPTHKPKQGCI